MSEPDVEVTTSPQIAETGPRSTRTTGARASDTTVRIINKAGGSGPEIQTPVGTAPVIPLFLIGFGAYLMWFAVKYWRGTGPAVWPSYPVKSVLQGKGIPPNITAQTPASQVAAYESGLPQPGQPKPGPGPGPQPTGSYQNMAKMLLSRYGWGPGQLAPLLKLWTGEDRTWNPKARNPRSGALGIAQALGHGVACSQGSLGNEYGPQYGLSCQQAQEANSGSGLQQIRWGLGYIKARYGSPQAAYAAWLSRNPHWY